MSVQFKYGGTEANLPNPQRDNAENIKFYQALGRAAGGQLYVYDKGIETQTVILEFTELRQSEKDKLLELYEAVVGSLYVFDYTDHKGVVWNAQFLNEELVFVEIDDDVSSTETFTNDGGTTNYPTTTRGNGIWNVGIEMELTAKA